jgi:hypothetical protein
MYKKTGGKGNHHTNLNKIGENRAISPYRSRQNRGKNKWETGLLFYTESGEKGILG